MIQWPKDTFNNKYKQWYEQIVLRAQIRILSDDIYTEKHHIIPRSIGGNNSKSNLAILTAREHFICHWLLIKIIPPGIDRSKMYRALNFMRAKAPHQHRYSSAITSRIYEQIKPIISAQQTERMTGRIPTEEHRKKMSASLKGRPKSPEHRKKMSAVRLGKPGHKWTEEQRLNREEYIKKNGGAMLGKAHTKEAKEKMSVGQKARITPEERAIRSARAKGENNPMYGRKQTEEAKKKMSRLGMKHSDETKAKMRAAHANRPGRPLSEETKKKISEAHKKRNQKCQTT
jgi:hypothetical protein